MFEGFCLLLHRIETAVSLMYLSRKYCSLNMMQIQCQENTVNVGLNVFTKGLFPFVIAFSNESKQSETTPGLPKGVSGCLIEVEIVSSGFIGVTRTSMGS